MGNENKNDDTINFGSAVTDENGVERLVGYTPCVTYEQFSNISRFIGLALAEFNKHHDGIPQWCFDELGLSPICDGGVMTYTDGDEEKASQYWKNTIDALSQKFIHFADCDGNQDAVNDMFDGLKKIFLGLWD